MNVLSLVQFRPFRRKFAKFVLICIAYVRYIIACFVLILFPLSSDPACCRLRQLHPSRLHVEICA